LTSSRSATRAISWALSGPSISSPKPKAQAPSQRVAFDAESTDLLTCQHQIGVSAGRCGSMLARSEG
jgi:hypothetical protein